MKNRRILTAALLCICMVLPMAGCGKEESGGQVTVEGPASEADKMKTYDPPITLTFAKSEVVTNYPAGQDAQNNAMYQMWEDVMGIKVENSILSASSAMTEKMQLAITSDEIPDFAVVDAITLDSLIRNDMVTDMTDIYDQWATDNLKTVVGQQNNALFAPTISNGRYMAIPVANTVGDSYPILWIRSDWLEALDLEEPRTMEEVFEIAEKFTLEDPDGNGIQDTYGLYLDKDLNGLDAIMAAYEVYSKDEYWVKQEDGSFIAGCTAPDAKKPLEKLAHLYEIGGIDHEFAVKDAAKEEELIASGQIGIYMGLFFNPLGVMKDSVANVGADWTAVAVPAAEGYGTYRPGVNLNVYGYIYAKKGISNPEAIVVMLNHLCDGYAAPWLSDGSSEFYKQYTALAADSEISTAGPNNLMPFQMAGNINWRSVLQKLLPTEKNMWTARMRISRM